LYLGNLNARRDWGHARDYIEAIWLILQQPKPDDYVIATGVQHSVRDFVVAAARELGITIEWKGEGAGEVGLDAGTGKTIVKVDPRYFRASGSGNIVGRCVQSTRKVGLAAKDKLCRFSVRNDPRGTGSGQV